MDGMVFKGTRRLWLEILAKSHPVEFVITFAEREE